jgi:hypothetical protein
MINKIFLQHYQSNKEEIDKMKTRGLNTKFKIKGYKIGRIKGNITLISLKNNFYFEEKETNENSHEDMRAHSSSSEESEDILFRLKQLEIQVKQISQFLVKAFPNK